MKDSTKSTTSRFSNLFGLGSVLFCLSLPFLVPFDVIRNIDMQGYVLIFGGFCASISICLSNSYIKLNKYVKILLAVLLLAILLSTLLNRHFSYSTFGAPYIRLGALEIVACIMCGLGALRYKTNEIINYLYIWICSISLLSLPYGLIKYHSLWRLGGLFAQADIMAVMVACGILLGLYIYKTRLNYRPYVFLSLIYLASVLIITQTRAVILLTLLLSGLFAYDNRKYITGLSALYITLVLVFLLGLSIAVQPKRILDRNYASESINYRINLQKAALPRSLDNPLVGYGIGNLADAYDCQKLQSSDLQKTCRQGYFFNSSHNIYIDRFVGFGLFGGMAYLLLISLAIVKGVAKKYPSKILVYCLLLISLYYLTNVTSITLELLLWVLVFQCLRPQTNRALASR